VSFVRRIRLWSNRDKLEHVQEDAQMTPLEHEIAEEDFEEKKDDVAVSEYLSPPGVDFESDSEPPRHP
jgi:hypothetical protein